MGKARSVKPIRRRNRKNIAKAKKRIDANYEVIKKLESYFK